MLTVFGSTALDTIRTPKKVLKDVLGGAATFAAISASFFVKPGLIAVIGDDFPKKYHNILKKYVDLKGLTVLDGKTFRYDGSYDKTLSIRKTLKTELNVLADIMQENDWKVKGLAIVAIARDWNARQAADVETYPKHAMTVVDIPLWKPMHLKAYIHQQLSSHFDEAHYCNDEERWQSEEKWAVMKEGRKNALRLLDTEQDAIDYLNNLIDPTKSKIEHRPGSPKRCWTYCNVRNFCPQLRAERQEKR